MIPNSNLPPVWPISPLPAINELNRDTAVLVLDDDPTGTQTVRDVHVVTQWDRPTVKTLVERVGDTSFILTNSRSLGSADAASIAFTIGRRLRSAADQHGSRMAIVSRSDSTLRGHFPAEVFALADGLGWGDATILVAPFFGDAGRVTLRGTHYLKNGGTLTPVSESEFAHDPIFGYRSSVLTEWIRECGVTDRSVVQLGLGVLRSGGPQAVCELLSEQPRGSIVIADALEERDIEVLAAGAAIAENTGARILARTAASYSRARAGQPRHPTLTPRDIDVSGVGIVVFGSHTRLSSRQLGLLLSDATVRPRGIEVSLGDLDPESNLKTIESNARIVDAALGAGRTPVIFTDRTSHTTGLPNADRAMSTRFSEIIVRTLKAVRVRPSWILAKGGITSSDLATKALGVETAQVRGQIAYGVSLWKLGAESRYPGLPYIVFPGNVGDDSAVRDVVRLLIDEV